MKFIHMSDCHIGGWREEKMRLANAASFKKAVDICIEEKADFVLISGDLLNTAMPGMDSIKLCIEQLKRFRQKGIPVYAIAGSHDYSATGQTFIDVLEMTDLLVNVAKGEEVDGRLRLKFTIDEKTGAKITGLVGRRKGLEKSYFHYLDRDSLEREQGFKLFMFHTAIAEMKPKELEEMDAMPVSLLPKGFSYYAGGHVHVVDRQNIAEYNSIVFPGPVFPNNFTEFEKLKRGSIVLWEDGRVRHLALDIFPAHCIKLDCNGRTSEDAAKMILKETAAVQKNAIVSIRCEGMLVKGKPTDINFTEIFRKFYDAGAYFVMKNTVKLTSPEFEAVSEAAEGTAGDIEDRLIKEYAGRSRIFPREEEASIAKGLITAMNSEKLEGETAQRYADRIVREAEKVVGD